MKGKLRSEQELSSNPDQIFWSEPSSIWYADCCSLRKIRLQQPKM